MAASSMAVGTAFLLAVAVLAGEGSLQVSEGFLPGAGGVRLFYRKVGTGKDLVVFLHGGPGSNFRGSGTDMDPLARGRTLVMYDQRGSGRSDTIADPAQLTAAHHVRDLEAVREHFGAARMSLIGLSWGSGLAVLYAADHPQRVARLLLVSPMPATRELFDARRARLASLMGEAASARQREIRGRLASAGDEEVVALCREASDLTFRLYLAEPTPEKLRHAQARCDIPPAAIRNRPAVETATVQSLGAWDLRPLLAKLKMPARVLEGADSSVPLDGTREWARALPNARLVLLPRAGHELFVDQPRAFLEESERFLSGGY
jgi:proline iminopeptidase